MMTHSFEKVVGHNVSDDVFSQSALVCICQDLFCCRSVYVESESLFVQWWRQTIVG